MTKKAATIKDIARKAEVSVATVSRCLNDSGYVEEATRQKILRAVEELDYRPNRLAQGLKKKPTRNIVLMVPDIQNPFYSSMAVTAQQMLMKKGYTITFFNTYGDRQTELDNIRTMEDIGADGVIFATVALYEETAAALRKTGRPIVAANIPETRYFDTVEGDAGESTYLSTKYLIGMGHKKIAFAGAAIGDENVNNRKSGFLRAMKEAGLPAKEEYIFEMGQVLNSAGGIKAGYYFSALQDSPTAVCCSNDLMALGVYQAFHQLDIRIPDQISVTGVDDIIYSDLCNPRLTTVTNDSEEYAKVAITALLERIEGKYEGEAREYRIDRRLIVRDSVRKMTDA